MIRYALPTLVLALAGCVAPYEQPYLPAYAAPQPYPLPRPTPLPVPLLAPAPAALPAPAAALEPLLPAGPDAPVEVPSTEFFPVDTGPAVVPLPTAPAPAKPAAIEPPAAVPFMGFRPMRGQTRTTP